MQKRSLTIMLIVIFGLLLTIDGIVAWLAKAPAMDFGWGLPVYLTLPLFALGIILPAAGIVMMESGKLSEKTGTYMAWIGVGLLIPSVVITGWALPWSLGTAALVAALLMRLDVSWPMSSMVGIIVAVVLAVPLVFQGEVVSTISLQDSIVNIIIFLILLIGETGLGIALLLPGRASMEGANFWVMTIVAIAAVILVNFIVSSDLMLGDFFTQRIDLTEGQSESLSELTVQKLESLTQDVTVMAFFRDNDPRRLQYARMLEKFKARGRHFDFELIDPDRYPDLVRQENVNPRGVPLVVKSGQRREYVAGFEEKDLTAALIKVVREGEKIIYFSTWHGEKTLDQDMGLLQRRLTDLNYTLRPHNLAEADIPVDCSVFVIAGPQQPYRELEIQRIEDYLSTGNKLLVMLDPSAAPTGLEDLLVRYGISVQPNVLIERQRGMVPYAGGLQFRELQSPYVLAASQNSYGNHPVTADLTSHRVATAFFRARSVGAVPVGRGVTGESEVIVHAGSQAAFAEANVAAYLANPRETVDPEGDERGPFPVGVLATAQPTSPLMADRTDIQTRVIAFGDADFATDQVIGQEQGNLTLVTNAINWLGEEESLIAIQPRDLLAKPAIMSADEGTFVFLFSIWLYPAVIFLTGILIFLYRRNRMPATR